MYNIRALIISCLILMTACAPARRPIPAGEIPRPGPVSREEEAYGEQVLNALSQQYRVERAGPNTERVRAVVDRLAGAAGASQARWHVYVFDDNSTVNAAATRGNYMFVWSGMLRTVRSDGELAAVLGHEMGHVLAGHTQPTPGEEANEILSSAGGQVIGQVLQGSQYGALAGAAGAVTSALLQAAVVNPESQRKEFEADQIGLFLMADAGYNPQDAVSFWEAASKNPEMRSLPIEFLSTHPSNEKRLAQLEQLLPDAMNRYRNPSRAIRPRVSREANEFVVDTRSPQYMDRRDERQTDTSNEWVRGRRDNVEPRYIAPVRRDRERWYVVEGPVTIYDRPGGKEKDEIREGTVVEVVDREGPWLKISQPTSGFVLGRKLAPVGR